jgi:hypothetical protein
LGQGCGGIGAGAVEGIAGLTPGCTRLVDSIFSHLLLQEKINADYS